MITNLILHLVNISMLASSLCVVSMTAYLQTKPETLANNQNSFKDFQQRKALVWMECTMSAAIKQHNYILIFFHGNMRDTNKRTAVVAHFKVICILAAKQNLHSRKGFGQNARCSHRWPTQRSFFSQLQSAYALGD